MIKLKEWIVLITFVTIMSTVFLCLVPSVKLKSAFAILCTIVIIYTAVSPLVGLDIEDVDFEALFNIDEEQSESFSALSDNALLLAAQDSVEKAALAKLSNQGVKIEKVKAQCKTENSEIILFEIAVYGSFDEAEKNRTLNLLEEFKSQSTKIIFVSGEKDE